MGIPIDKITEACDRFPKQQGVTFSYGTAGFRTKGATLASTLLRVGMLAVLRSKKLDGRTIGVMITASHNPAEDNGAKLIDPRGEMLDPTWEAYATTVANAETASDLLKALTQLVDSLKIDRTKSSSVICGRDTRPSGNELNDALQMGIKAMGQETVELVDLGVVTTPCVHYAVKSRNLKGEERKAYGEPTLEGYLSKIADAFNQLMTGRQSTSSLVIDCANGVGFSALQILKPMISSSLPIELVGTNIDDPAALNSNCGADYVKTGQRLPPAMTDVLKPGQRACSLDGDADRVVFYYLTTGSHNAPEAGGQVQTEGKFRLLDGDKIATLAAGYIGDLVKQAGLGDKLKIGVVQTAYANGSSTAYLRNAGLPVRCVPTGVKHLHHAAERYDIGVYFEANGHGTVLFSPETIDILAQFEPSTPAQDTAAKQLAGLISLINQAVGDAISDFLLVEVILAHKRWGPEEWDAGYEDLPNRLLKVSVADRNAFKTEDAERKLTSPDGMQAELDELTRKFEKGRSFVRPSGTEDCVRVYAEASTEPGAIQLGKAVQDLVERYSA